MKFSVITDLHAGCRNDSVIFNKYFLRFYNEIFFPYLREHQIHNVICLGDVLDRRKYVNFSILNSWRTNVFEVLNKEFQTHVILGNHDCYYRNDVSVNSLQELLRGYDNIHVINRPMKMDFDGTNILMMPWIVSDKEEACREILQKTKCEIVMGHFDIIGFQMYSGLTNDDAGFSADIFDKFDMVLSGHYHHRSSSKNIHYLGAPYEMVWSDYGDEKGFHIFDTETRSLTFVENPLNIFFRIDYDDTGKIYESMVKQRDFTKYKDCYVKIVIQTKNNQNLFDQFMEALYKENPADVTVVESQIESDVSVDSLDETKDTLTLLIEYIEGLNMIDENKKPLIETMRNLYLESMSLE